MPVPAQRDSVPRAAEGRSPPRLHDPKGVWAINGNVPARLVLHRVT